MGHLAIATHQNNGYLSVTQHLAGGHHIKGVMRDSNDAIRWGHRYVTLHRSQLIKDHFHSAMKYALGDWSEMR